MKRCLSTSSKTKVYAANQITPISYLQFELFKPKPDTPLHSSKPIKKHFNNNANSTLNIDHHHKLIANRSYIGSKGGGDLYTRTRNCLYQNMSKTASSIHKHNKIPLMYKSIPKKSNLDKLMLSLKSEIDELSKQIRTTPSTPNPYQNNNNSRSKSLIQQRSFIDRYTFNTNERLNDIKQEIEEGMNNYYERKLDHFRLPSKDSNIDSNNINNISVSNNNGYSEHNIHQKVVMHYNSTYNPINNNANNSSSSKMMYSHLNKSIAIPLKYQSSYQHNNSHNTSELSSLFNPREDNYDTRSLIEKNKCLEQIVSTMESKLLASNRNISELKDANKKYEQVVNDLSIKNKLLQDKEREELENYSIQPYSANIPLKANKKKDGLQMKAGEEELKAQINELTEENKGLSEMIKKSSTMHNEDMNKVRVSNDKYLIDIKSMNEMINKCKEELEILTEENSELKQKMTNIRNDCEGNIQQMQSIILNKDSEIVILQNSLQQLTRNNNNSNDSLMEKYNQMQITLNSLTEEKEKLSIMMKQKENENHNAIEELNELNSQLKTEMNKLQKEYQGKTLNESQEKAYNEEIILKLKEQNESLLKENKTQLETINENKETMLSMTNDINNNKEELNRLLLINDKLTKENQSRIDAIINEHNSKYSLLQKENNSLSNQFKLRDTELNQIIISLKQEKDSIDNRLNSFEKENKAIVLKDKDNLQLMEEYKTINSTKEIEIGRLTKENAILNESIDRFFKEMMDKDEEIHQIKERLILFEKATDPNTTNTNNKKDNQLETKLNEITAEFERYKSTHPYNESEVDLIKEINTKQKDKIDLMTKLQKEDNDDTIATLKEEMNKLQQYNDEVISQLEVLKKKHREDIEAISLDLNNQILNYKAMLNEKDNNDKKTSEDISIYQIQLDKMNKEREDINNQLKKEKETVQKTDSDNQMLRKDKEELLIQLNDKSKNENELLSKLKDLNETLNKAQEDYLNQIKDLTQREKEKDERLNKMHQTLQDLSKENEALNEKILSFSLDDPLALESYRNTQELEEMDSLYNTISRCKEAILIMKQSLKEKDALNKEKESEIEQYKGINSKLLQSLETLKAELIQSRNKGNEDSKGSSKAKAIGNIKNDEDTIDTEMVENLKMTIDNLRELVLEKEKQITELLSTQKEDNMNRSSYSKNASLTLVDAERCEQYNKRIDDYKIQLQTEIQQNGLLKEEIKDLNRRVLIIQSYEGKITNYEEFLQLWMIAFDNYKPKGSEKKEAFYRIQDHLTGYEPNLSHEGEDIAEKKSILSKIFK